ncbi:MAG: FAD-binding protein [Oscillospiraceae bacterium]|nr:FAD-binding protein [Oscillospiraceae bacterium]
MNIGKYDIPVYEFNTVVVGTGAAGYNAADRLHQNGQSNIAIVTEGVNCGISRNTGSDKQTYYKLTLSGGEPDSVGEMAKTLFDGQCVDGDHALCEAALSAQNFLRLVDLGVPFPRNAYGEYIGYKTDHDPRRRATSVGPYTSKLMTEKLQHAVEQKNIPVFDNMQVVKFLVHENRVLGLLCWALDKQEFVAFSCKNVICATGAPAGMYRNSVFPLGVWGATGAAFEAGVKGKNLTEWQFGLASVAPRWNVSGTYMQVLPKFISTDEKGNDARELQLDLGMVFLKGYQWPFDVRKLDGSSAIDIIVHEETCQGRRVFLDFRENPGNQPVDFAALPSEAREYLEKAGACFGTPLQRLLHMNAPAVSFYQDKGVDLATEPLEIALCAQHNNGGMAIDHWWQTNIEGFFAAGEAAASHGVYRPGGSALNAGQTGSARAAMYIAAKRQGSPQSDFAQLAQTQIAQAVAIAENASGENNVNALWQAAATTMSDCGGAIRKPAQMQESLAQVQQQLANFNVTGDVSAVFRYRDVLICQLMYLGAMLDYMAQGGTSRGSALYVDEHGSGTSGDVVQEANYADGQCSYSWRPVRPIPQDDDFFENVWRSFRETGNIE